MNFKSQDYLAKLLAKENLEVQHGNYQTASFDVENRVLRLPLWQAKGKAVYDLLVGHEVGHALYTPVDGWHNSDKVIPGVPKSMINIIEDIRIEKKIQNTYPGIIGAFKQGYKVLFDDNLFGTVGKDLASYNFMDRLNIHSKGRGYAPVEFDKTEQLFVDLAMGVETWEDVLKTCQEISDWLKNKEDYEEPQTTINGDENGNTENEQGTGQSNCMEEGGQNNSQNEGIREEEDSEESLTDKAQRENEGDLLDKDEEGKQPLYSAGMSDDTIEKVIVSYNELKQTRLNENRSVYDHPELPGLYKEALSSGITKTVNLMAKEFERKKAAWEYSRSTEAKKGSLNTNKLHQYQYSEDIFLTVNRLATAKSHGMFMLIDFSGSMAGILADVIKQTITIALFCKKVGIPFEAYSFTTRPSYENGPFNIKENEIENVDSVKLVNIISSSLKKNDFNEALMHLYGVGENRDYASSLHWVGLSYYDRMGGTPLIQSIIASEKLINKLRAKTGVQNMNVMILTDGMGDWIQTKNYYDILSGDTDVNKNKMRIKFGNKMIVGDTSEEVQESALKVLGELTGAKVLGFFLCGTKSDFWHGYKIASNEEYVYSHEEPYKKAHSEWAKNGVVTYKDAGGYDEFFIVKVGTKNVPTEFEVEDKKGTGIAIKDIKREFRKFNKNTNKAKMLVNKITDAVAA